MGRCVRVYVQSVDVVELLRDVLPERVARAPDGVGGGVVGVVVWSVGGDERATRQRARCNPNPSGPFPQQTTHTHIHMYTLQLLKKKKKRTEGRCPSRSARPGRTTPGRTWGPRVAPPGICWPLLFGGGWGLVVVRGWMDG